MKTCCFIGHRNTEETPKLREKLEETILQLIKEQKVKTFLFGSRSGFDYLCLDIVTELKNDFPDVKRIYVRSHYPFINDWYREFLLNNYDDTIMPCGLENAGRASYVERNQAMINDSDFCVFYYNENYAPPERKLCRKSISTYQPKSGTAVAYQYAKQKKKNIINLYK